MTLRTLSFCILISLIAACNSGAGNKDQAPASNADSASVQPGAAVHTCDTTGIKDSAYAVRNDRVISEALGTTLSCKSLDSVFRDAKKDAKTSPNKYENKKFDTTVIFHIDCDSVIYLASAANCFPLHLNIQSQRLSFDGGYIKVGMAKDEFTDRYHLKRDVPDIIKITELEGANELVFFFSNGSLSKIIYNNLYVE